jgi:hypothetical protein
VLETKKDEHSDGVVLFSMARNDWELAIDVVAVAMFEQASECYQHCMQCLRQTFEQSQAHKVTKQVLLVVSKICCNCSCLTGT